MKRQLFVAAALLGALPYLFPSSTAAATRPAVPDRVVKCAECGMSAKVANRFTSQLVQGGSTLYFCDIGDLAAFIGRTHPKEYSALVHDFTSGEWVDVNRASFVIDKKTFSSPMGWGVAAFQDPEGLLEKPMNFEALQKALQ